MRLGIEIADFVHPPGPIEWVMLDPLDGLGIPTWGSETLNT
jgi:hypothetical protein